jgi:hypothetical protein
MNMTYLAIILALVIGYGMGLIHKGIHIHVDKSEPKQPEGYTPSLANMLPAEVQQYYTSTHGQNRF